MAQPRDMGSNDEGRLTKDNGLAAKPWPICNLKCLDVPKLPEIGCLSLAHAGYGVSVLSPAPCLRS